MFPARRQRRASSSRASWATMSNRPAAIAADMPAARARSTASSASPEPGGSSGGAGIPGFVESPCVASSTAFSPLFATVGPDGGTVFDPPLLHHDPPEKLAVSGLRRPPRARRLPGANRRARRPRAGLPGLGACTSRWSVRARTGKSLDRGGRRPHRGDCGARRMAHHVEALAFPSLDPCGLRCRFGPKVEVLRESGAAEVLSEHAPGFRRRRSEGAKGLGKLGGQIQDATVPGFRGVDILRDRYAAHGELATGERDIRPLPPKDLTMA